MFGLLGGLVAAAIASSSAPVVNTRRSVLNWSDPDELRRLAREDKRSLWGTADTLTEVRIGPRSFWECGFSNCAALLYVRHRDRGRFTFEILKPIDVKRADEGLRRVLGKGAVVNTAMKGC
jgi:hypothetical protein